jgi:hypothetical protein
VTGMDEAVDRLRATFPDHVLAPDPAGLAELERIAPRLPPEVRRLYGLTGGMRENFDLPAWLMPPSETARTIANFRDLRASPDSYDQRQAACGDASACLLLFSDGNSNYLGLHLTPPYAPRGFALDHEEPSLEPKFKSLASMLDALVVCAGREGGFVGDMPADYPVTDAVLADATDRALSLRLLAEYRQQPEIGAALAFAAMQLSHPDDMEAFCDLLDSPDMWVAEKMCGLVGLRRYRQAIGQLTKAAMRGGNRTIGAIVALRDWQDEDARAALRDLRSRLGKNYSPYFPKDLS